MYQSGWAQVEAVDTQASCRSLRLAEVSKEVLAAALHIEEQGSAGAKPDDIRLLARPIRAQLRGDHRKLQPLDVARTQFDKRAVGFERPLHDLRCREPGSGHMAIRTRSDFMVRSFGRAEVHALHDCHADIECTRVVGHLRRAVGRQALSDVVNLLKFLVGRPLQELPELAVHCGLVVTSGRPAEVLGKLNRGRSNSWIDHVV
ncbi:hypothetical protein [Paraburkholderia sp. SIMBA_030]|uniref:hypothetical protein n=1 Tax=Paraburkholderia sp. SIMBA_030 TaxID=3085773 RepID=UPI003979A14D